MDNQPEPQPLPTETPVVIPLETPAIETPIAAPPPPTPLPPIVETPPAMPVQGNKNTLIIVLVILLFIIGLGTLVAIKITDQINAPVAQPSPAVNATATPTQKITPTLAASDNQDLDKEFQAIPTLAPLDTTDLDTDLQGL